MHFHQCCEANQLLHARGNDCPTSKLCLNFPKPFRQVSQGFVRQEAFKTAKELQWMQLVNSQNIAKNRQPLPLHCNYRGPECIHAECKCLTLPGSSSLHTLSSNHIPSPSALPLSLLPLSEVLCKKCCLSRKTTYTTRLWLAFKRLSSLANTGIAVNNCSFCFLQATPGAFRATGSLSNNSSSSTAKVSASCSWNYLFSRCYQVKFETVPIKGDMDDIQKDLFVSIVKS